MLGGGDWEKRVGQGKETYALRRDLGAKRRALDTVPVRLEVLVVIGMVLGLGHICLQEGGPGENRKGSSRSNVSKQNAGANRNGDQSLRRLAK